MKKTIYFSVCMLLLFSLWSCEPSSITVGARLDAPYYERPARPGPEYVWIEGDWYVENGVYIYHQGYWNRPRNSHIWITGSWEQRGSGWYWRRGRWH
jgi:hypothetical protein